MSTGGVAPAARPLTETERNWFWAFGLVVASVLVCWGIYAAEQAWGPHDRSQWMVVHPVESAMRFVALPHFLVGFLFLTTSRGMRRARSWAWLAALFGVGALLSWAFGSAGGRHAAIPRILFLTYFAVHEFRDEVFFYLANGDAPREKDPERLKWRVLVAPLLVWLSFTSVTLLGTAYEVGGLRKYTEAVFGSMPESARHALGAAPLVALVITIVLLRRYYRRRYAGGVLEFVRAHRPIFVVFGGLLGLILLDLVVSGRIHSIVTLHVTAWYVFVMRGFGKRPPPDPPPRRFTWKWMRTTRAGFAFLHVGLLVATLIAAAVWAYAYGNAPSAYGLSVFVSRDAFPYWTIMHVTISFLPR